MPTDYLVERRELLVRATYAQPFFGIWRDTRELLIKLYIRTANYGVQLNDMKWNQASSVGDIQLSFYVYNLGLGIRVWIDRLEIEAFDYKKVDFDQFYAIVTDVIDGLRDHDTGITFSAFSVSLGYHGKLTSGSAEEFTRRFTNPPSGLGAHTGAGAVFYYGPDER